MKKLMKFALPLFLLGISFGIGVLVGKSRAAHGFSEAGGKKGFAQHQKILNVRHKNLKKRLVKRLGLSKEQTTQLNGILASKKAEMTSLQREMRPKMRQQREDFNRQVLEILTEEQKKKFNKMKKHGGRRDYKGKRGQNRPNKDRMPREGARRS